MDTQRIESMTLTDSVYTPLINPPSLPRIRSRQARRGSSDTHDSGVEFLPEEGELKSLFEEGGKFENAALTDHHEAAAAEEHFSDTPPSSKAPYFDYLMGHCAIASTFPSITSEEEEDYRDDLQEALSIDQITEYTFTAFDRAIKMLDDYKKRFSSEEDRKPIKALDSSLRAVHKGLVSIQDIFKEPRLFQKKIPESLREELFKKWEKINKASQPIHMALIHLEEANKLLDDYLPSETRSYMVRVMLYGIAAIAGAMAFYLSVQTFPLTIAGIGLGLIFDSYVYYIKQRSQSLKALEEVLEILSRCKPIKENAMLAQQLQAQGRAIENLQTSFKALSDEMARRIDTLSASTAANHSEVDTMPKEQLAEQLEKHAALEKNMQSTLKLLQHTSSGDSHKLMEMLG